MEYCKNCRNPINPDVGSIDLTCVVCTAKPAEALGKEHTRQACFAQGWHSCIDEIREHALFLKG